MNFLLKGAYQEWATVQANFTDWEIHLRFPRTYIEISRTGSFVARDFSCKRHA